ncbi:Acyl-CoA-binding domain-containing protein 4 [Glycine max]|nr:Acyl-CoA-binding domain-containing protein 4 [Glycine max]
MATTSLCHASAPTRASLHSTFAPICLSSSSLSLTSTVSSGASATSTMARHATTSSPSAGASLSIIRSSSPATLSFSSRTPTMEWSRPTQLGEIPSPRAGHAGVTVGENWFIVSGGDNKSESTGLLSTCPNHLSLFSTIFSTIGATPTLSLIASFLILSCRVLPHIHRNILISATPTLFSCWLLTAQHSVPAFHKISLGTLSYAFSKSIKIKCKSCWAMRYCSITRRVSETIVLNMSTLTWSVVTSVQGRVPVASEGLSLVVSSYDGEDILVSFGGYNGRYNNENIISKFCLASAFFCFCFIFRLRLIWFAAFRRFLFGTVLEIGHSKTVIS